MPVSRLIYKGDDVFENLICFVDRLGHWGYLVIFAVVAMECQADFGLFMPGESLVMAGGFFARRGLLDYGVLIFVVSAAAILGDTLGYELGRYLGREWLLKQGLRFGFRSEHLERVESFFGRHGGKAVFASHFLHLMRSVMPFVAGSSRMAYPRFLIFNATGGIIWSVTFVLIGYFAGAGWQEAARWMGRVSELVGGALLLVIALVWLRFRLERNKSMPGGAGR